MTAPTDDTSTDPNALIAALQEERDGVLHFNPGSAGPRRFTLPIAVATLDVDGADLRPTLVTLDA